MNYAVLLYSAACLALTLGMNSCSSNKEVPTVDASVVKYGLKTGACFGTCPIYELEIYEGGKAILKAIRFLKPEGTSQKMLEPQTYAEIEDAFAKSDFFSYADTFPSLIPDLPGIWISHNNGTQSKTIYGKEDRPEKLVALQELLQKVVTSGEWLPIEQSDSKNRKPESAIIYNQLIVQPYPNKLTEDWISRYKAYGLKMERKISPDLEYYLLSYDESTIAPDEMLAKVKADPAIRLAEFDKKVESRGGVKGRDR